MPRRRKWSSARGNRIPFPVRLNSATTSTNDAGARPASGEFLWRYQDARFLTAATFECQCASNPTHFAHNPLLLT
jgi:hypothetical protein